MMEPLGLEVVEGELVGLERFRADLRDRDTGVTVTPDLRNEEEEDEEEGVPLEELPDTPLLFMMADSIAEIHSSFSSSVPAIKTARWVPSDAECCSTANMRCWCFVAVR